MLKWEDAFEIKLSKNARGESVYDVYRKGTNHMLWADIPVDKIDDFLKTITNYAERVMNEEFEQAVSTSEEEQAANNKPMEVEYNRMRKYPSPWIEDDEDK